MAHITKRKRSDGVIIYDAALKITKNKRVIHREKRSFLRYQSEQLKLVSLHQSSAALSRYINLKAEDLDI
jgi:hypothetical protein